VTDVAEQSPLAFGGLLRRLRTDAGLTQEELAHTAGLSPRAVSDLERGINLTARRDTARLLADALGLGGTAKTQFEAAARGRAPADGFTQVGVAAATRTLPRDIASFTGRAPELRELLDAADPVTVVGIHAIGGMAGIGKTVFAVHAAHQLAPRYPDGQIFLPLHGHTPGQRPVEAADALASLLLTVGVAAAQIPPDVEARIALWRDRLAGKQLLLLLDDAADSEQVWPLVPGGAGSLVLVTSRRHLTALDDARVISLDTLPTADAADLLVRLANRPGLDAGDAAVREIIRLCGHLPLAIGMLARQLYHHPAWTAGDLAADLAAARDRLELMTAENLSVTAAFDLSYQDLSEAGQIAFRRLGLHPGNEIDAYALAALNGIDIGAARRLLTALYDQYLLTEPSRGRYRLHDLIREHARLLAATDPPTENDAALDRLLDYYLHTARAAGELIPRRNPAVPSAAAGAPPAQAPGLATREDAMAWLDAERLNLHAVTTHAAIYGKPVCATAIPAAIHAYLRNSGYWHQALTLHHAAVETARRAGDQLAEACALTDIGDTQHLMADYPAATASLTEALQLLSDLGHHVGEAGALYYLGAVQRLTGQYAAAAVSLGRALELYQGLRNPIGEANALNYLGALQYLTGDYAAAVASLDRALELYRRLGNRNGEANALNYLGAVQQETGDYTAAMANQEQALDLFRHLGNRLGEANALNYLGAVQYASGDHTSAIASLTRALELYRDLGAKDGEPEVLNTMGEIFLAGATPAEARVRYEQARAIASRIGSPLEEARALEGLGRCFLEEGLPGKAAASLREASSIYRRIGSPYVQRVDAVLRAHSF
jgi:tetratricopeptide (TPR) repeat protein/transcriptional regulator with XRE-family HTH domain